MIKFLVYPFIYLFVIYLILLNTAITQAIDLEKILKPITDSISGKVVVGKPNVIGNGCNRSNAKILSSPNGTSFSIIFDELGLEAYNEVKVKTCNITIPLVTPIGYALSLKKITSAGFAQTEGESKAQVIMSTLFNGFKVQSKSQEFTQFSDSFDLTTTVKDSKLLGCGLPTALVINTTISAQSYSNTPAFISISTTDIDGVESMAQVDLSLTPCK
jgi:Domain of unknown function (DUF4360)